METSLHPSKPMARKATELSKQLILKKCLAPSSVLAPFVAMPGAPVALVSPGAPFVAFERS